MAMMPSVTAGNPYANDPIIEQDLIDPDGESPAGKADIPISKCLPSA